MILFFRLVAAPELPWLPPPAALAKVVSIEFEMNETLFPLTQIFANIEKIYLLFSILVETPISVYLYSHASADPVMQNISGYFKLK